MRQENGKRRNSKEKGKRGFKTDFVRIIICKKTVKIIFSDI